MAAKTIAVVLVLIGTAVAARFLYVNLGTTPAIIMGVVGLLTAVNIR